jgi:hypothetical protein
MEKWFALKATKITEIKVRYETQIKDIEAQIDPNNPNDVMPLVAQQLKVSMQSEIDQVNADIDAKRKEEIRGIRAQFT